MDFRCDYHPSPDFAARECCPGRLDFTDNLGGCWDDLPLALLGRHQAENAPVALATVARLAPHGVELTRSQVARALSGVRLPARTEVIGRKPLTIVDSAHNAASMAALLETLGPILLPGKRRADLCVGA